MTLMNIEDERLLDLNESFRKSKFHALRKRMRRMMSHREFGKMTSCGPGASKLDFAEAAGLWMARLYVNGGAWRHLDLNDVGTECRLNAALRDEVSALMWAVRHPAEGDSPEDRLAKGRLNVESVDFMDLDTPGICRDSQCGKWFRTVRQKIGLGNTQACPESFLEDLRDLEAKEQAASGGLLPELFRTNIETFARAFGLTEAERDALAFLVVVHLYPPIRDTLACFDFATGGSRLFSQVLSVAFQKPFDESIVSAEGTLMRSRLIELNDASDDCLCSRYEIFGNSSSCVRIASEKIGPEAFFQSEIAPAPRSGLSLDDYGHVPEVKNLLMPYLASVLQSRKTGVNVLIYGPPGTGQTELVRAAAEALGAKLYEVGTLRHADKESDRASSRLARWNIAEKLYRSAENTLLVIDESEDIINEGAVFVFGSSPKRSNKAELNQLVEAAPVPTFWITNTLIGMDPALIRRFDIVLEVPVPPEKVRRRIAGKAFGNLLSTGMLDRLARSDKISPAVIARTASVVGDLHLSEEESRDAACEKLLSAMLDAQSLGKFPGKADALPAFYDTRFVNTTANLDEICEGLKRCGAGRLCLYGPPGTGKTAYVRWLARELGLPLIAKRASDLLSMFVGGTEALICDAFEEAKRAGALLLIDEADSFLRDRELSQRSWEVTQVNELLTQMEIFSGIFCATTNLFENIDRAALRRFDLKAKFDFLRPEQRLGLLERHLAALGLGTEGIQGLHSRLARLDCITPGDFAAIERGSAFSPIQSAEEFLHRLEDDAALKNEGRKKPRIGF